MATTSRSTGYIEDSSRNTTVVNLSKLINQELDFLEESFLEARIRVEKVIVQINEARNKYEQIQQGEQIMEIETELRELKTTVSKLNSKIPFDLLAPDDQPNPIVNLRPRFNPHKPIKHLLLADDPSCFDDDEHPTPRDLISSLRNLAYIPSMLLRYFFVFPKKTIIKKSLLVYWPESGGDFYDELQLIKTRDALVVHGFIKPVYKNCSMSVCGYWMHPFVHTMLSTNFRPENLRSTLSSVFFRDVEGYSVISIDEEDVIYDGSPKHSCLKFLHLGKWQRSPTHHHIEMEEPDVYFKNFKNMNELRYISFRGVSMITELPKVVKNFFNLQMLDLKACYNLEAIPADIGNMSSLTHLDMSECYFLDHMPASLSKLCNLRVLKGFYVGETKKKDSCALEDLHSLRNLWKLNIYTSARGFPNVDQLTALQDFVNLRKLTISWGGCSARREECESIPPRETTTSLPNRGSFSLEKLDLQCVPNMATCHWLKPQTFKRLKKLYIRGGDINDFWRVPENQLYRGPAAERAYKWKVEVLRLKHLAELQMDWSEIMLSFPRLKSLEMVQCPNLTSFPCNDDSGLWTKPPQPPTPTPPPPTRFTMEDFKKYRPVPRSR